MNSLIQINSQRIQLIALDFDHLMLLSESREKLENALRIPVSTLMLNAPDSFLEEFHQAIPAYLLPNVKVNSDNFAWFTHWIIIEKDSQTTIGGIGASGPPNESGETMIGYFIDGRKEGKGFASEAVEAFIQWMTHNPKLKSVIADTLIDGFRSQKVLQKAGFVCDQKVEEGLRWRKIIR